MKRIFARSVMILIAAVAALYAGDWAVLRVRITRHTAFSSVQVNQFLVAQLKGNRQEYFHMGTAQEPCVTAIFPHAGDLPCWWLRRHAMRWKVIGLIVPEVCHEATEKNGAEDSRYIKCEGMKYSDARTDDEKFALLR